MNFGSPINRRISNRLPIFRPSPPTLCNKSDHLLVGAPVSIVETAALDIKPLLPHNTGNSLALTEYFFQPSASISLQATEVVRAAKINVERSEGFHWRKKHIRGLLSFLRIVRRMFDRALVFCGLWWLITCSIVNIKLKCYFACFVSLLAAGTEVEPWLLLQLPPLFHACIRLVCFVLRKWLSLTACPLLTAPIHTYMPSRKHRVSVLLQHFSSAFPSFFPTLGIPYGKQAYSGKLTMKGMREDLWSGPWWLLTPIISRLPRVVLN